MHVQCRHCLYALLLLTDSILLCFMCMLIFQFNILTDFYSKTTGLYHINFFFKLAMCKNAVTTSKLAYHFVKQRPIVFLWMKIVQQERRFLRSLSHAFGQTP